MRIVFIVLFAVCMLTACTTAKPLMAPSGAQGYKVWCEITSQCYEKAAQMCPHGYTIEADQKDYWGMGDIDGNLIIVCKQPVPQPAPAAAAAPTASPALPNSPTSPRELDPAHRCDACQHLGGQ
jgi:hypothetical protein